MIGRDRCVAIVPARSGSKRVPHKNKLLFAGQPLISWTIKAAKSTEEIDRVVVSTDDLEIKAISEKNGASVPFLRPKDLASDNASAIDVLQHAILELASQGECYEVAIYLQPTSPLRDQSHISAAIDLFNRRHAKSVVSVSEVPYPEEFTGELAEDFSMKDFWIRRKNADRSQLLKKRFFLNGAIFVVRLKEALEQRSFLFEDKSYALVMEGTASIDIDTWEQFRLAESIKRAAEDDLYSLT